MATSMKIYAYLAGNATTDGNRKLVGKYDTTEKAKAAVSRKCAVDEIHFDWYLKDLDLLQGYIGASHVADLVRVE